MLIGLMCACQSPILPGTPLEGKSKKKERNKKSSAEAADTDGEAENSSTEGFDQVPTDPAGGAPKSHMCLLIAEIVLL